MRTLVRGLSTFSDSPAVIRWIQRRAFFGASVSGLHDWSPPNGPNILRVLRTTLAGWKRHKNHPDGWIRRRFRWEVAGVASTYSAVAWAANRYFRKAPALFVKMSRHLDEIGGEFGWTARLCAALGGPFVLWKIRQEERRIARGWTYEPPTFYEVNVAVKPRDCPSASRCRYLTPNAVSPQRPE